MAEDAGAVAPADGVAQAAPARGGIKGVLSGLLRLGLMYGFMMWMRKSKTPPDEPEGAQLIVQ